MAVCSNETRQGFPDFRFADWNEKLWLNIDVNGLWSSWRPLVNFRRTRRPAYVPLLEPTFHAAIA